jgi:hypothetical protein
VRGRRWRRRRNDRTGPGQPRVAEVAGADAAARASELIEKVRSYLPTHAGATDGRRTTAADVFSPAVAHRASSGSIRLASKTRSDADQTGFNVELRGLELLAHPLKIPLTADYVVACDTKTREATSHDQRDNKAF